VDKLSLPGGTGIVGVCVCVNDAEVDGRDVDGKDDAEDEEDEEEEEEEASGEVPRSEVEAAASMEEGQVDEEEAM
jgi:hypothetical protein